MIRTIALSMSASISSPLRKTSTRHLQQATLEQLKQQIEQFGPGGELSRSGRSGEFPDQR